MIAASLMPRRAPSRRPAVIAAGGGGLLLLACLLGAAEPARFWGNALLHGFLAVSLALAGLLFIAIQLLSGAGWWVVIRRVPEAMAAVLPAAAAMLAAVWLGRAHLYPWLDPRSALDPILAAKRAYLNEPFFALRALVILAAWALFALLLRRGSLAQDRGDGLAQHRRLRRLAGAFVPVFALTVSIACFDWLMSLEPHWYSTIFAAYHFAGLLLGGVAAIALAVVVLSGRGGLAGLVSAEHLHDLGKLLFGFATFWAYLWVSQYLLIWYANLPEEAVYYLERTRGRWTLPFALVPILNWLLPFCILMSRAAKRSPRALAAAALLALAGRWLDLYLQIAPSVLGEPHLGAIELLCAAGYTALFLALFLHALGRAPLLALRDPYLAESLAHHAS